MSADKSDIYKLWPKLYDNDQSVVIAFYIKNIALIANVVNRIESAFDIRQCLPTATLDFLNPILYGGFCFRVPVGI